MVTVGFMEVKERDTPAFINPSRSDFKPQSTEKSRTSQPQRTPLISPESSTMFPHTMAQYFKSSVCPLAGRC